MGSESGNRNGGNRGGGRIAAESDIPATAEKVVRSVKEVVDCTEDEIFAVLQEYDMDVNRAVEKLLSQDTFHEVKSKRERRKEGAFNSRTRGNNVGLSRGGKTSTGSDWSVEQSGFTHVTYNEHAKAIDKGDGGSVCPSVGSVARKSIKRVYFSTDNGRQSLRTGDSVSDSAQASSGPQPSITRVSRGHLSMADIVRMGRTSSQDVSHNHTSGVSACGNSESSLGLPCQNHSEQQVFHDEWPVIEQPIARNSQALNMSASTNANGPLEHPCLHVTAICLNSNNELDAAQVSRADIACDNAVSEKNESVYISSKHTILSSNTGLESHSNSNSRNTLSSDLCSSYDHHEDVSSAASVFQQLSIGESKQKVPTFEDDPAVVIPTHLQALGADCPHLSFGTYNGGSSSASSVIPTSDHLSICGMEEKSATEDDSLAQFLDARHFFFSFPTSDIVCFVCCTAHFIMFCLCISSVYSGDRQLEFDVLRGVAGDKNSDFFSSPNPWFVKLIVPEETLDNEHSDTACVSDPSLQKSHWVNTSLPLKQPGLHSRNHFISPRELVMEPGVFAIPKVSAHPQDPTVQLSTPFHQLPDTIGYPSLPQNKPYITTINSQQAFSGYNAYNQSSADRKCNPLQNKNEFLTSSFPPATARDAFGYGNLGSSVYSPGGFLSNPSLGCMMPSSNLNEILSSQYNDRQNLNSIQQRGSFPDYAAESRSLFIPERTHYNFMGQPNQASLSQYASPGYSDFYHSQTRVSEELQQLDDFQDFSLKQLHQFWQRRH